MNAAEDDQPFLVAHPRQVVSEQWLAGRKLVRTPMVPLGSVIEVHPSAFARPDPTWSPLGLLAEAGYGQIRTPNLRLASLLLPILPLDSKHI